MKKHIICLNPEQRQFLERLIKAGSAPARQILHAQILLKVDASEAGANWSNKQIREAFGAVESTIWRVRTRFLAEGLPAAVARRVQPERPEKRKLAGEQEAHLIALACQNPPEGCERWTLRLLGDQLVEWEIVSSVSHETVRTTLKKTRTAFFSGIAALQEQRRIILDNTSLAAFHSYEKRPDAPNLYNLSYTLQKKWAFLLLL